MGKSRKFVEGGRAGGKGYDPHPMEWKFPRGGRVWDKSVLPGGYKYFLKLHNFISILGSQTLGDGLYASSLFRVASKTIRERTRPPLTLLPRAARVCLSRYSPYREFALRLWWDGPVRMFCNKGISVSRISKSMYYRHVKLPDNLDTSTFKRPQTCKKGISLSLKSEPTFQWKKTLLIYLKQPLLLLY